VRRAVPARHAAIRGIIGVQRPRARSELKMTTRYLIVGNGPAGSTAAQIVRERDPDGDIQIVGAERHAFYSRPGLAYYLTGQLPEGALFSRPDKEYQRAGIRRTTGTVRAVRTRTTSARRGTCPTTGSCSRRRRAVRRAQASTSRSCHARQPR
jgi:hypothetical protein